VGKASPGALQRVLSSNGMPHGRIDDTVSAVWATTDFPQIDVGDKISGPLPLSRKTVSTIQRSYERDFDTFGYDIDPPSQRFLVEG